ncbi:phospholipid-binding protein MlaC [Vibrio sp.]|nr:phospholipid-binding protein MlaC [Vibrio sp.]
MSNRITWSQVNRFFSALFILLVSQVSTASETKINQQEPYTMMKAVSEISFARLKSEQDKVKQDPNHLKLLVEEELMPYVNYQYTALKVLGSNLKGAKKEDVRVFIKAFRGYLVTSFAQVLTQYTDQVIEFGPPEQLSDSKRITAVKVNIIDTPRPDIKLQFKLRKNKKTGDWAVYDMIAEGVSLLSSKQSEWSSELRKEGILSVAEKLETLGKKSIQFEAK